MALSASASIARECFFEKYQARASKRNVAALAEKAQILLDSCHPWQRNLVLDVAKRIVALVAGRGGKTTGCMVRQLRKCLLKRGARCLFIAKSKPAARELIWEKLKSACARLGLEPKFHEQTLRLTLRENGSTIRLVGADDTAEIDKLRGQPFDDVVIDEAASHRPELVRYLIEQAVGPRLGDFRGSLELVGTPGQRKRGMFWELSMPGSARSVPYEEREKYPDFRGWSFHGWSVPQAAPYVREIQNALEEGLETKEREGWSDTHPTWMTEYLGRWAEEGTDMTFRFRAEVDGQPWNVWDPPRDHLGIALLPQARGEWHFGIGFDLGGGRSRGSAGPARREKPEKFGDPTAVEVAAWDDGDPTNRLYHIYEFHSRERLYARKLADLLLGEERNLDDPDGIIGAIGWPDVMVADIGSLGGMVLEELANVYGLAIEEADKSNRDDAVEGTNGDLVDGRIVVLKGSVLAQQLEDLQWEIDQYGLQVKNKRQRDDAADAWIYIRSAAFHLLSEAKGEEEQDRREARQEAAARRPAVPPPAPVRHRLGEFDGMVSKNVTYYDDEAW